MQIDILTLFPEMFSGYMDESILKRAQAAGHLHLHLHNIRDYATDKHRVTDEPPYGGGGGMVLKPEPVFAAVESVIGNQSSVVSHTRAPGTPPRLMVVAPRGRPGRQTVGPEVAQAVRSGGLGGR
jgi:tRNA (guanine37-N1)-methyltransferase